jgi:DNA-directed RNA polymerase specialized sigma24 family protein
MSPDDEGSISKCLIVLKGGDDRVEVDAAVKVIWEQYFDRLVRLTRACLRHAPRASRDEEDVALSAFNSFCSRAADGRFPRLDDRGDLWRILMTIAARKAAELLRRPAVSVQDVAALDQIIGKEPTPEFAATVADEVRRLLDALPKDSYRAIALKKLEGCTSEEIAHGLGCSTKNVEYKLKNIRATWLPIVSEDSAGKPTP